MAFTPFVIGQRLTAADLNAAVGAVWTAYTPTWITTGAGADPVISNGDFSGRWRKVGNTVTVRIRMVWGSLTTSGAGDWEFGLPAGQLPAATNQRKVGKILTLNTVGATYLFNPCVIEVGSTTIRGISGGSYYSVSSPVAWVTNNFLELDIDYETA